MVMANKKKKVVIIHTSDVSLEHLKSLFNELAPDVCVKNIIDDSLLTEVLENGGVTTAVRKRICAYALSLTLVSYFPLIKPPKPL